MGTWGTKLYDSDITSDVRSYYQRTIKKTNDGFLTTEKLLKTFRSELEDSDDAPLIWLALADTQWDYGRLEDHVKEKALYYLNQGGDLSRWNDESPENVEKRKKVLEQLKEKILSPQPPEKKIEKTKHYCCQWKMGDVYAYPLNSEYAKQRGIDGRYFLFHKVDEGIWYPEHIIPIVRVKITKDDQLPSDEAAFNALDYVQTGIGFERCVEKGSKVYYDEYGYLPQYRLKLINTSKRIIPKSLIYVGNFQHVDPPLLENIPRDSLETTGFIWNFFDTHMIDRYFAHTLKQAPIYKKK